MWVRHDVRCVGCREENTLKVNSETPWKKQKIVQIEGISFKVNVEITWKKHKIVQPEGNTLKRNGEIP